MKRRAAQIQQAISPEAMALIIAEISKTLAIEIPDDVRYERFFTARIIESVKANSKSAALFIATQHFLRQVVNGR